MKSRVVPTVYSSDVVYPEDFEAKVPPTFRSKVVDGVYHSPIRHNNRSLANLRSDISIFQVRKAAGVLVTQFDSCPVGAPLSFNECIVGREGVNGIDRISMSTGVGYPLTGPKNRYFDDPSSASPQPNRDLRMCIEASLNSFSCGSSVSAIVEKHLKDERVKPANAMIAKTRVIGMCGLALNIQLRRVFLPWMVLFRKWWRVTGVAVGANCFGWDWSDFHEHLHHHPYLLVGDYKSFDMTLSYELMCGFMFVIEGLITKFHLSDWVYLIDYMWALLDAISRPTYVDHGDLIFCFGTNPSGQATTADLNSVLNLLLVIMAWSDFSDRPFFECVRAIFYGDDHVVSTNDRGFNFHYYKGWCEAHGLHYTTADKKDDLSYEMTWDRVTFLKRSFVYNPALGCFDCPIELSTIFNMLSTCVLSKEISHRLQCWELLKNAHMELQFHPGLFEIYDPTLRMLANAYFPEFPPLPTSEDYREERFLSLYRGVLPTHYGEFGGEE